MDGESGDAAPAQAEDPAPTIDTDRFSTSWPQDLQPQAAVATEPETPMTPVWEGVKGFGLGALTTAAFTGAVEAHNSLLERFQGVETRVTSSEKDHKRLHKDVAELTSDHKKHVLELEDKLLRHDQKLGEMQRLLTEGQEEHKGMIKEHLAASAAEQESRKRELDEAWTPKFSALQKAVEELCSKQAELVASTLPQWQAELRSEIQKLATDLSQLRRDTERRDGELEDSIKASNTAWKDARQESDVRFAAEVSALEARLTVSEGHASRLEEAAAQAGKRLDAADAALSQRLEAEGKRLETLAREEVDAAQKRVHSDLTARFDGLEGAFKQADYERLRHMEEVAKRLDGLESDIASSQNAAATKTEAVQSQSTLDTADLRAKIETKASSTEVANVAARLANAEENAASLANALTTAEDRLASTSAELLRRLEAKSVELEEHARTQAGGVRDALTQESAKVAKLEASHETKHSEHEDRHGDVTKELRDLRSSLEAAQKASRSHADEAAAAVAARLDDCSEAVKGLTQDVDQLGQLHEQSGGRLQKLQEQVDGIQRQAAPIDDAQRRLLEMEWYLSAERTAPFATAGSGCLSCGRRAPPERSTSPSTRTSYSFMRGGGFGDPSPLPTAVGWSWRPGPQPPQTARPSSATFRRAAEPPQEAYSAAGPAHSAARAFQRKVCPPASTVTSGATAPFRFQASED